MTARPAGPKKAAPVPAPAPAVEPPEKSVQPKTAAEWRRWLSRNHTSDGIWLVTYREETGKPRVEPDEAITEALCFGWVDSHPRDLDAKREMQWFAPRQPGSPWSMEDRKRVDLLIVEGRIARVGLSKVESAKQDGSWEGRDMTQPPTPSKPARKPSRKPGSKKTA